MTTSTPRSTPAMVLLDSVDALTQIVKYRVEQPLITDGRTTGSQTFTVDLPPLLEQLESAIQSSIGGTVKGASDPAWRILVDGDALHKFSTIASQIGDWCRIVGVSPVRNPVEDLRSWHAKFIGRADLEHHADFYVRKLNEWAAVIRSKIDPPNVKDLPWACPTCGADEWWDPATGDRYPRPLIVTYRPDGAETIMKARALCRACEEVWGVRELAYEIEQKNGEVVS